MASAPAIDLRVRLHNGAVLHRSMQTGNVFEVCNAVHALVRDDLPFFESTVAEARLVQSSNQPNPAHGILFTNICGKVMLVPGQRIFQKGVLPMLTTCTDGFGRSTLLSSPVCNLSTHSKQTATLFRGASSTRAAQEVIEHAICPTAIGRITVHMLVATARLGRNINMHSYFIENALKQDTRWTATPIVQLDHMSYMKGVRITNFSPTLAEQFGIITPKAMVLNISKHGSVNFFVTIPSELDFFVGLEVAFLPYCHMLLDVVRQAS